MPRNSDLRFPAIPNSWPFDSWDTDAPGRLPAGKVLARPWCALARKRHYSPWLRKHPERVSSSIS
jgi:hypothetical protein